MYNRIFISLFCILFFAKDTRATHLVGGEIYYDCLGNDDYQITLKVYRDCINGVALFDNPAAIGLFDAVTGALLANYLLYNPVVVPISSTISVPCYIPAPGTICEEEATYTHLQNIPGNTNGYLLVYQRCCRNGTIVNLNMPGDQGSTLVAYMPPANLAVCNSSARFNYFPPIYLCQNIPLIFDHSATDPDGDSLVYELCAPYGGANSALPMPQPPNPPPYLSVVWQPPYNASYQMDATPALAININSGIMTGTPNMMGTWVVGVSCKEYRNGVLICTSIRDFQFNVIQCQAIPVTGQIAGNINSQVLNCTGLTISFSQSSSNASNYYWNFGDPTTTSDTSNLPSPTYTYAASGTYTVTFIVNPGSSCFAIDTVHLTVTEMPDIVFTAPPPQCLTGNSFDFLATGQWGPLANITWNFGALATPATDTGFNPQGIIYSAPGAFPVTVTVNENGCIDSHTDTVIVYPMPAFVPPGPVAGCTPLTVQFQGDTAPAIYTWHFGDGDSSNLPSPSHIYYNPGVYDVTVIVQTTTGCIRTDTFYIPGMVTTDAQPTAGFTVSPDSVSMYDAHVVVTDQSMFGSHCVYYFGDGTSGVNNCNPSHTYTNYGLYTIMQLVYNGVCADTAYQQVEVYPEFTFLIPNAFTPNGDGLNDYFFPEIMATEDYHFMIFDRWGMLLFETYMTTQGWDGKFMGRLCQEDVYVWKVEFIRSVDREWEKHIGHVSLIR
ncbi:MAG TPA: PKD domain-containing protein [Bacteroidia bacterium]|nr:PKD domain-containing protein [Bacteroidia bacterium]